MPKIVRTDNGRLNNWRVNVCSKSSLINIHRFCLFQTNTLLFTNDLSFPGTLIIPERSPPNGQWSTWFALVGFASLCQYLLWLGYFIEVLRAGVRPNFHFERSNVTRFSHYKSQSPRKSTDAIISLWLFIFLKVGYIISRNILILDFDKDIQNWCEL